MALHPDFPDSPHAILEPQEAVKVMDIFGNDTITIIEVQM
jgi:hypothetical protein